MSTVNAEVVIAALDAIAEQLEGKTLASVKVATTRRRVNRLKGQIRNQAVPEIAATPEEDPYPGIQLRTGTVVNRSTGERHRVAVAPDGRICAGRWSGFRRDTLDAWDADGWEVTLNPTPEPKPDKDGIELWSILCTAQALPTITKMPSKDIATALAQFCPGCQVVPGWPASAFQPKAAVVPVDLLDLSEVEYNRAAQAFYEATCDTTDIVYTSMLAKPSIVAGLRAAIGTVVR